MEPFSNRTISNRGHTETHIDRDDDDERPGGGLGRMTTANFVLMFGILALVLLTIRAILMKTNSARCRRKNPDDRVSELHRRYLNSVQRTVGGMVADTNSGARGSTISAVRPQLDAEGVFVLSPPSYDNNNQYPTVAPPPYTPGAPAPIFKPDILSAPPPYEFIPEPFKATDGYPDETDRDKNCGVGTGSTLTTQV